MKGLYISLNSIGMNQTLNISQTPEPLLPNTTVHVVLSVLAGLTCVCGIVGNGVVIWLLGFRVQRNPFCIYIFNLAVADLLFLLCMVSRIIGEAIVQNENEKVLEVVRRVKYFAYTMGLSLLAVISTQRCISVLFPIWYKVHSSRHLCALVCALLWLLSLLLNVLVSFFCSQFNTNDNNQCLTMDTILGCVIMGIFTPVMTLSSMVLLVRLQRRSRQWRRHPSRLGVVILASILMFLLCSLPLGIYWFILYWYNMQPTVERLVINLSRFFSSLSSSSNPFIYFLVGRRSQTRQEPLEAVLRRVLQEEQDLESKETPSTDTTEGASESQPPTSPTQTSLALEISTRGPATTLFLPRCPCGLLLGAPKTPQLPVPGSLLHHAQQPPTGGGQNSLPLPTQHPPPPSVPKEHPDVV
ncbi:mas-related G-protein coupled receptor member D-like [Rhynchocyon petersi]